MPAEHDAGHDSAAIWWCTEQLAVAGM